MNILLNQLNNIKWVKIIIISSFEITLTSWKAFYVVLCTVFVTIGWMFALGNILVNRWFDRKREKQSFKDKG